MADDSASEPTQQLPEPAPSSATPAQGSVSIQQSPIVDFWDEQSREATADLHPPLFEDCLGADASAQLQPAPVPPCPKCQEAICIVRLPRIGRRCDEFHCNKCAHQWEIWDNEKAQEDEAFGITAYRSVRSKVESDQRAQEAEAERVRLEAEKATLAERARKAEERNFLELDKRLAQHAQSPPQKSAPDKSPKTLPTKRRDLSDELDRGHLTEKQRECLSLRLEYGLTVTEIATRLGRHRTSINECIVAGSKNMERAHNYEKRRKRRAIVEPDQFD